MIFLHVHFLVYILYIYKFFSQQIEFEQKRKAEGKKSREDKEKVTEILFAAFEKHQYYNIKSLEKITKQPIVSQSFLMNIT